MKLQKKNAGALSNRKQYNPPFPRQDRIPAAGLRLSFGAGRVRGSLSYLQIDIKLGSSMDRQVGVCCLDSVNFMMFNFGETQNLNSMTGLKVW